MIISYFVFVHMFNLYALYVQLCKCNVGFFVVNHCVIFAVVFAWFYVRDKTLCDMKENATYLSAINFFKRIALMRLTEYLVFTWLSLTDIDKNIGVGPYDVYFLVKLSWLNMHALYERGCINSAFVCMLQICAM